MNTPKPDQVGRRHFIKTATATALAGALQGSTEPLAAQTPAPSLIAEENRKPGAIDWQLTRVRLDKQASVRASNIEGYCSHQSILAGETLNIFVSTNPTTKFTIEIFRTGYYGGRGARLMTTLGPMDGKKQPDPVMGEKRLMECKWEPSASVKIPADWPSGVYLGRLTTVPDAADKPYWQNYVVFIVRDTRKAGVLLQCSDNTWQAYNKYPENT